MWSTVKERFIGIGLCLKYGVQRLGLSVKEGGDRCMNLYNNMN